jgi:YidC/Oxa1 family membrane protein insertase
MDTKRLILFVIFSFSLMLFWSSFEQKNIQNVDIEQPIKVDQDVDQDVPEPISDSSNSYNDNDLGLPKAKITGDSINIVTDLLTLTINTVGGDIRELSFNEHQAENSENKYQLMTDAEPLFYVAQSGLTGEAFMPNHNNIFSAEKNSYKLDSDKLIVPLIYENSNVLVKKTYEFNRGSYLIQTKFEIQNKSNKSIKTTAYFQLVHDGASKEGSKFMPSFTGPTFYTEEVQFEKFDFNDLDKIICLDKIKDKTKKCSKDATFEKAAGVEDYKLGKKFESDNGWIGIIQRYFAASWILPTDSPREFFGKKKSNGHYSVGVKAKILIPAGQTVSSSASLFAGPQEKEALELAAPGMYLVVDYWKLHFIASPLFYVLTGIHKKVDSWGISIILLTILIKLVFYPLSAASYRSMGQMRELAPRLQSMKEKFGDDKQKMQQAMMELYKTEKINPLGGCLPILVQIPVFIALYWVLLGSVELRGASFMWLSDLSKPDTLFGSLGPAGIGPLPILMAASMFLQTKLNPKPTDPMQARLMIMMPIIFSFFFFFFPAGLVLYWLVNNILSIAQQWYVNKKIHAEALKKKGNA